MTRRVRRRLRTQSRTVWYQNSEFCGFSTQWFSSGKYTSFDGTPRFCSVLNSSMPWFTGTRMSCWLWMISVGVLKLAAEVCGEYCANSSGFSQ